MLSRVVPATSLTITRSWPEILFSSEDLPTFGRPMSARRTTSSSASSSSSGSSSTTRSSRSPVPRPCAALTACGSPRPSLEGLVRERHVTHVVDLVRGDDHRTVLQRRRRSASSSSPGRTPAWASMTNIATARLVERGLRLLPDRARHRVRVLGVEAARVDEGERPAVPLGRDLLAVARDARPLVHDGLAAARQAVDQRGLADVRVADDRDLHARRRRGQLTDARDDLVDASGRWCRARSRRRRARAGCPPGRGRARRGRAARRAPSSTSAPSSAARRRARSVSSAVRKTFTSASGTTTVPMSRPSATQSPSASSARWRSCIARRDLRAGGDLRGALGDLGRADRLGDVVAVEQHALAELDLGLLGMRRAPRSSRQGDAAVHRPRVQVREARARPRRRARRWTCRPPRARRWR